MISTTGTDSLPKLLQPGEHFMFQTIDRYDILVNFSETKVKTNRNTLKYNIRDCGNGSLPL